jgi:hypothetical protein
MRPKSVVPTPKIIPDRAMLLAGERPTIREAPTEGAAIANSMCRAADRGASSATVPPAGTSARSTDAHPSATMTAMLQRCPARCATLS